MGRTVVVLSKVIVTPNLLVRSSRIGMTLVVRMGFLGSRNCTFLPLFRMLDKRYWVGLVREG